MALQDKNDLVYIEPKMNIPRMFKKMFFGVDIFESGIIQNDNKEVSEVPKVEADTKV